MITVLLDILLCMKQIHSQEEIENEFTDLCRKAERTIFKLGVLQNYVGEDASASWQTWEARGADYANASMQLMHNDPRYITWMQFCRENAPMTRLQIVETPLTPYAEWQLAVFREYQKEPRAERVHIVTAESLGGLVLPPSDILIFDNESVLQWTYVPNSDGKVEGGIIWNASEGDDMSNFLALRDDLLDRSTPLV